MRHDNFNKQSQNRCSRRKEVSDLTWRKSLPCTSTSPPSPSPSPRKQNKNKTQTISNITSRIGMDVNIPPSPLPNPSETRKRKINDKADERHRQNQPSCRPKTETQKARNTVNSDRSKHANVQKPPGFAFSKKALQKPMRKPNRRFLSKLQRAKTRVLAHCSPELDAPFAAAYAPPANNIKQQQHQRQWQRQQQQEQEQEQRQPFMRASIRAGLWNRGSGVQRACTTP